VEKTPFQKDIDAIVAHAINEDEELVRVCGQCEEESGPQRLGPGQGKSHGYCKRHYIETMNGTIEMANEAGQPELAAEARQQIQQIQARPDDSFPPDLRQHPELVDHAGKDQWLRKRAADRAAQRRELSARV